MHIPRLSVCSLVLLLTFGGPVFALSADEINQAAFSADTPKDSKASKKPIAFIVKMQVLLSRRSISPGELDGRDGENYRKAVAQFRRQNNLGEGDTVDEATWTALGGPSAGDIVTEYPLSKQDASADFARTIPKDYAKQATMKTLTYINAREMLAERFHMSEELLVELNPRADFDKEGERIFVTSIERKPPETKVERIEAVKDTGMVVVYGPKDVVLASYPATIGSDETASPAGEHTIKRIVRNPTYHYDPEKNFQQGKNKGKLILPRGANNPVGTVWIALSKPTFGIHGTPEPAKVSKTSSHGCIRLTNWDAEELADMVKPGVRVQFVERSGS